MDIIIAIIFIVFLFGGIVLLIYRWWREAPPEFINIRKQNELVEVIKKEFIIGREHEKDRFLVTFRFPDGMEKEFNIEHFGRYHALIIYGLICVGDIGKLTYKEVEEARGFIDRRFIKFERDF